MRKWVEALPDPVDPDGVSLPKSRRTRTRILKSAVTLLADHGSAAFSPNSVAAHAGLTRPALRYHYHDRSELLVATVHYILRQRILSFEAMARDYAARPSTAPFSTSDTIFSSLGQFTSEEYRAFCAVATLTQTEPDFAKDMFDAVQTYERTRVEIIATLMPELSPTDCRHRLDILHAIIDGILLPMRRVEDHEQRQQAVHAFLMFLASSKEGDALFEAAENAGIMPGVNRKQGAAGFADSSA